MRLPFSPAYAALAFTILIWGFTPVFVRGLSLALGPYDALPIRLVISSAIFLFLLVVTRNFSFPLRDMPRLLLISFLGLLGYYAFSVFGFTYAPAGVGTLIMSSQPMLIGLLAWAAGAERLTRRTIFGLLISLGGSVLLVSGDDLGVAGAPKGDVLLGCFLILLASIAWASYVVFVRPLTQRHGAIKVTGFSNALIVLPALPFLRPDMGTKLLNMPLEAKWGLFFLATFGTASVISWNYASPRLRPSALGAGLYIMPVVAILAGWLLLDEVVTWQIVSAAAIILAGVAVAQWPGVGRPKTAAKA